MNICNYRVDDRLVHGVVSASWIPYLRVDRVIVIDKEASENQITKSALRMATPKDVRLSVIPVEKAIENIKSEKYGTEKIMVVVKSPRRVVELVDAGIKVDTLTLGNLGNICKEADSTRITQFITVNKENKEDLYALSEKGVKLEAQLDPREKPIDFLPVLKEKTER